MEGYFDFIIYLAFEAGLNYENKREINLEQLGNYRLKLLEMYEKYHLIEYEDEEFIEKLNSFYDVNNEMTLIDEYQNYMLFLSNNMDIFGYRNGSLYLRDGITLEFLEEAKFNLSSYSDKFDELICSELIRMYDSVDCLDAIDAVKIKQETYEIVKYEREIEELYKNYSDNNDDFKKILDLSNLIDFKMALIGNMSDQKMCCYDRIFEKMYDSEVNPDDLWIISDYMFSEDEFYQEVCHDIDYYLCNKFQRAIFDDSTLVYDKIEDIMSLMWAYRDDKVATQKVEDINDVDDCCNYEDEFDDDIECCYDDYIDNSKSRIDAYFEEKKIDMLFYLNYINSLNKYQDEYGSDSSLDISKRRLLYLLDDNDLKLYNNDNLVKHLKEISSYDIDYKKNMEQFYIISRLFLVDLLEGYIDDEYNLRKVLFVLNYYEITNDIRIKRIIDKYRNNGASFEIFNSLFYKKKKNIKKLSKDKNDNKK